MHSPPPGPRLMIENSTAGLSLLDPDREVVVTGEDHHQPALRGYAPHADGRGRRVAVELRFAPTAAAGRPTIEVLLDGQRVGELTAKMSQRYAPLVEAIVRDGGRAGCIALVVNGRRGIAVELRLAAPVAFPAGPFPPATTPQAGPAPERPGPPRPTPGTRPAAGPGGGGPDRGGPPAPPARRRRRRTPYWIGAGVATLLIVIGANIGSGTATVTATAGSAAPTTTAAATTTQKPPPRTTPPAAVAPAAVQAPPDAGSTVARASAATATPRATTPRATSQSRSVPAQTTAPAPAPKPAPASKAAAVPQLAPKAAAAPAPKPVQAAPKAAGGCDPNYSGCVPIAKDVDCAGGSGNGPAYVRGPVKVTGTDIYGLDGDKDGTGCDS